MNKVINRMTEKRFALLIASSQFQENSKLQNLDSPPHDVKGLKQVLKNPRIGGFTSVEIIINETSPIIRKKVAQFILQRKRDDIVLIYFSGHGLVDSDGALYLAASDTEYDFPSATGLEAQFITREIEKRLLQRVVLILDCCYSGAFDRGTKSGGLPDLGVAFNSGRGRIILTASNAVESAWQADRVLVKNEYSLFTYFLVEGMETGAAAGEAPWITVDDLYVYAFRKVVEAPKPTAQTPQKWGEHQEGAPIIIAKNPHPPKSKAATAKPPPTLAQPSSGRKAELQEWTVLVDLLEMLIMTARIFSTALDSQRQKSEKDWIVYNQSWVNVQPELNRLKIFALQIQSIGKQLEDLQPGYSGEEWAVRIISLGEQINAILVARQDYTALRDHAQQLISVSEKYRFLAMGRIKEIALGS
jgi:hypothetical protein